MARTDLRADGELFQTSDGEMRMFDGLYESPLTVRLRLQLEELGGMQQRIAQVSESDQADFLVQHLSGTARRILTDLHTSEERIRLVNQILHDLGATDELLEPELQRLERLARPPGPGVITYADARPTIPLGETALLTNARDEPQLGHELRAELDTSDRVDLCAPS